MEYGRSIQLNDSKDIYFNSISNSLSIVNGTTNLEQSIKILLGTFQGEIALYPDFGVNYPQLLGRDVSLNFVSHAIKSAVIRDPRVRSINEISLTHNGRALEVYIDITTEENISLDIRGDIVW